MERLSYLRVVAAVLFTALCAWVGAGLYPALTPRPAVAAAGEAPAPSSVSLSCIALREERCLFLPDGEDFSAAAGTRVGAGEALVPAAGGAALRADRSAVFMPGCDGWEGLRAESLMPLSVEGLLSLLEERPGDSRRGDARLVYGFDWHLAAYCPERLPLEKGAYTLLIDGYEEALDACLTETAYGSGGTALLFRIQLGDTSLLELRKCTATLILPPETEG